MKFKATSPNSIFWGLWGAGRGGLPSCVSEMSGEESPSLGQLESYPSVFPSRNTEQTGPKRTAEDRRGWKRTRMSAAFHRNKPSPMNNLRQKLQAEQTPTREPDAGHSALEQNNIVILYLPSKRREFSQARTRKSAL